MRALALSLIVVLLSMPMIGCGQKGPLYMPEKTPETPEQQSNENTK